MKTNNDIQRGMVVSQNKLSENTSPEFLQYQLGFKRTIHQLVTPNDLASEVSLQLKKYFDRMFGREILENFQSEDIHFSRPHDEDMIKMKKGELLEVKDLVIFPPQNPTRCKFYVGETEVFMKGEYAEAVIHLLK